MTPEEAAALVKSLVPPGPMLILDSEKYREVLTDALVTIVTRAVAAEREAWLSLVNQHLNGKFLNVAAFLAAAIRGGEG